MRSPHTLLAPDTAVDLGSTTTAIHIRGRGLVLEEPSVLAVRRSTGHVAAVGADALWMCGNSSDDDLVLVRPLQNGTITEVDATQQMFRRFLQTAHHARHLAKPRVSLVVPCDLTPIERRAAENLAYQAGARHVHLVESPLAAAIGSGLTPAGPVATMVAVIGGGTTDIAIMAMGGIVVSESVRVGGDALTRAIAKLVRQQHGLLIGESTAEAAKLTAGSAHPSATASPRKTPAPATGSARSTAPASASPSAAPAAECSCAGAAPAAGCTCAPAASARSAAVPATDPTCSAAAGCACSTATSAAGATRSPAVRCGCPAGAAGGGSGWVGGGFAGVTAAAECVVYGRDVRTGLPGSAVVSAEAIREAVGEPLAAITAAVRAAFGRCPPELSGDLLDRGVLLAGGGALLPGLDTLLSTQTGVRVRLSACPLTAAVLGAAAHLNEVDPARQGLRRLLQV